MGQTEPAEWLCFSPDQGFGGLMQPAPIGKRTLLGLLAGFAAHDSGMGDLDSSQRDVAQAAQDAGLGVNIRHKVSSAYPVRLG